MPENIKRNITKEQEKDWFRKVQNYRNTATHHYLVPLGSYREWVGDPQNVSGYTVFMISSSGQLENPSVCKGYLENMVRYISSVWEKMAKEFD